MKPIFILTICILILASCGRKKEILVEIKDTIASSNTKKDTAVIPIPDSLIAMDTTCELVRLFRADTIKGLYCDITREQILGCVPGIEKDLEGLDRFKLNYHDFRKNFYEYINFSARKGDTSFNFLVLKQNGRFERYYKKAVYYFNKESNIVELARLRPLHSYRHGRIEFGIVIHKFKPFDQKAWWKKYNKPYKFPQDYKNVTSDTLYRIYFKSRN